MNQTASIGSTITFNCSVTGHPKPTITWTKDNDSHSIQSIQRAKIITVDHKSLSQLVITGVTSEDYGKYQCVANNSAGVKESQAAFLYPVVAGKALPVGFCTVKNFCNSMKKTAKNDRITSQKSIFGQNYMKFDGCHGNIQK